MISVDELLQLLSKPSEVSLEEGRLTLSLEGCGEQELTLIKALIEQAQNEAPVATVDYSAYFQAVTGSPMYKPGNPALAIRQAAKAYDLDVEAFTRAFKAAHGKP